MGFLNVSFNGNSLGDAIAEDIANKQIEKSFEQECKPIITFDFCKDWAMQMKEKHRVCEGFIISVQNNPDPRNENDKVCVTVGMLDENGKTITMDGTSAVATIFHGGTVDEKMLDNLNGKTSKMFRFSK